jgi:pimeloyl-ACP methyl ester carboxylesterase
MPEVTVRGLRFHVQTVEPAEPGRAAPVVVFVHGLVLDNLASFFYTLAGPVARAGARSVLYDLRGHGRSERPPTGYTTTEAVADLFAIMRELCQDRPVYLVANSWGGVIALNAALARPELVAGLVLIEAYGAAGRPDEWNEELLNTLSKAALVLGYERIAEQLLAIGERQLGRQVAAVDALVNSTTLLADLAAAEPLRPAELAAVTCPVLAVYGESSDLLAAGRTLAAHLPDCRLHVLSGQAHTVLREATKELLEVLLTWLTEDTGVVVAK